MGDVNSPIAMSPVGARQRVAVVGAGMGGLSAALELAASGAAVKLFERSDAPGGKMRRERVGSVAVDAGPTVLTMLEVFEQLFARAGRNVHDEITVHPLDRLARHAWLDGTRFDLYRDEERTTAEIREVFGRTEADAYLKFSAHCRAIYDRVREPFLGAETPGVIAALKTSGLRSIADMMRVDWHRSMWRAIDSMLTTPHLKQLFARYATYYGSSPYAAPATLNLIAEVERQGVWVVEGGMHELAKAMARVLGELGVEIVYDAHIDRLGRQGEGWEVNTGQGSERFDAVVFNGDPGALAHGLLGEGARKAVPKPKGPRSSSALTWCLEGTLEGDFEADFHNVFFSDDYRAEFDALFGRDPSIPSEPSVYLCAQSRAPGATHRPGEPESIFLLVNAPATSQDGALDPALIESCEAKVHQIMRQCGSQLHVKESRVTAPPDFASRFPSTGGALYGGATHNPFAPFLRTTARSKLPGLYLAGGSTHPGAGVPMASLSGSFAARSLARDRGLMLASNPEAIFGGTSTSLPPAAAQL